MKPQCLYTTLTAILIGCSLSCTRNNSTDVNSLRRAHFVNEDVFLSIANGTRLEDVRKKLGSAVRHQFTVAEDGHTWQLIRCFLHTGGEESYNFYQMLFRDDVLVKVIGWMTWEREQYSYRGTTATRTVPWDIEDLKYVQRAIDAPVVTSDQIQAELENARDTMEKYKGQGNIPAVVGYLFAPAFSLRYNKDFRINEKLRERFDGCRVSIGMNSGEVDELFGEPVRVFPTKAGRLARIYGDRYVPGFVEGFLRYSYVAVVFDSDDRARNVYSDLYFCNDWDPDMPPERRN